MKHTPGKWYLNHLNICSLHDTEYGQRYTTIAEVIAHRPNGNSEDHANALLISAAPDLLKVCKMLFCYYDKGEGNLIDEILPKLRNAINKAEGR